MAMLPNDMVGNSPIRATDEPVWHVRATCLPAISRDETGRQRNGVGLGGGAALGVIADALAARARCRVDGM
jgi:hypothetical protein